MGLGIKSRFDRWRRHSYLRRSSDYLAVLQRSRPVLSYIGYLGHQNVGDEALFQAYRDVLFPECLVVPENDFSSLRLFSALRSNRLLMLGGGTLINVDPYLPALEHCRNTRRPYVVWGTGVADLTFWRNHPQESGRGNSERWLSVLREADYIGVRGPRSQAWIAENGIQNVEVIGDPALSIAGAVAKKTGQKGVLGINLGSHDPVSGGQEQVFQSLLELIRHVLHIGLRVRYFSLHAIDQKIGSRLVRAVDSSAMEILPFDGSVENTMRQLAEFDFVVGQRLHATVLACALGIPNLSLSYQPKCLDFLDSIKQQALALPTETLSGTSLIERFEWMMHSANALQEGINAECDKLRCIQQIAAREIVDKINEL
jgi:polysaccharide pyruvyl transferase WcaK-like protein